MSTFDIEAEKRIIKQYFKDYVAAENRKDLKTLLKYPDKDIIILRPNEPEAKGMQAVRDGWNRWFKLDFKDQGEATFIDIAESGDLAYVVFHGKVSEPVEFEYKTLYALKKVEGEWKIAVMCFNTNNPKS